MAAPDLEPDDSDPDAPIVLYNSKFKLGFLSLVGFAMTAFAIQSLMVNDASFGGDPILKVFAMLVSLLTGGVLLQWAFDRRPALIIDVKGITTPRPPVGLVPWRVVNGLGISKGAVIRSSLMIAINKEAATEEELARWKRHYASGFLNSSVARFRSRMKRAATIAIPISFLAISRRELRLLLEERVQFHGEEAA